LSAYCNPSRRASEARQSIIESGREVTRQAGQAAPASTRPLRIVSHYFTQWSHLHL